MAEGGGGGMPCKQNKHNQGETGEQGAAQQAKQSKGEKIELGAPLKTCLQFSPVSHLSDKYVFCGSVLRAVRKNSRELIPRTTSPTLLSAVRTGVWGEGAWVQPRPRVTRTSLKAKTMREIAR